MTLELSKTHLAKFLKNNGNYTRSEIINLVNENKVLVNGKPEKLSYVVKENDIITIDNKVIVEQPLVYYLYNKPRGIVCTNNLNIKNNIIENVKITQRVFSIGRLDKDSRGLIILTNDGKFANKLINSSLHVEKEYIVTLLNPINDEFLENIKKPIILRGKLIKEPIIEYIDEYHFKIVLTEGKYRQIRRMVIASKNTVTDLKRIRIGDYYLDDLEEGKTKQIYII